MLKCSALFFVIVVSSSFALQDKLKQRLQCRAVKIANKQLRDKITDPRYSKYTSLRKRLSEQTSACEGVKTLQEKLTELSNRINEMTKMLLVLIL